MAAVAAPPQQVALDRLTTYPIIKDSLSTGISLLKSNPYSTYALNTATTLSHSILVRISPVLPYKEKVGGIANTTLDFVEEKFPFVNTPTQDLVRYVRTPADNGVAIAREYADAIQTVSILLILSILFGSVPRPFVRLLNPLGMSSLEPLGRPETFWVRWGS